jgi:serine/threonine kinase PknH
MAAGPYSEGTMPALDSLPGKIGPYRLLNKLGEGGMGVVYLARDAEGRPVAVKVLGPAVTEDPNARRRLFREVETMRRVRSRFVAEILDADVTSPSPYIVTRYVPGRTLDDVVRNDGPLRGAELERLATGLAAAIAAIHAAGVVHRDLKPGNVMIDGGHPVVIDFGIAHIPDATRLTQTGMVMGTPGYLAPEVIEGKPSTGAADVHAWGATVAFAATGRQPYGAGSYQTVFFRVLQGRAELDGVPAPLLPLVAAALDVDPGARPSAGILTEHCALLRLDGYGLSAAGGPNGTRHASVAVPWRQNLNGSALQPAGFGSAWPARQGRGVRSGFPGPAEAAADVADLLPPVDYQRPGGRLAGPPSGAPGSAAAYRPVNGQGQAVPAGARVAGHGLLILALGVAAVALSVLLPVAGTALALAVITLLRATDRAQAGLAARRSARGARPSDVFIVVVSAPWTVVRALFADVMIAPIALLAAGAAAAASVAIAHTQTLPAAGSWAAGAAVAVYAVGPGSGGPRRQLRRISATVIRSPASMTVAMIATWALAAAVVSSALSQPPVIWPATSWMLPHVLPSMGGSLHTVQQWLLRNTVGVLHVP